MLTAKRFLKRDLHVTQRIAAGGQRRAYPASYYNRYMKEGGQHLYRLGSPPSVTDFQNFAVVAMGPHMYEDATSVATIKAADSRCKVLFYTTLTDALDIGIGANIPTQTQYQNQCFTALSWNEIQVHDAANPSDKWVFTTNGTTPVDPWFNFTRKGGNMNKQSYRTRWLQRILQQLDAQPQWDGVFIDNVMIGQPISGSQWPFELPTQAQWRAASLTAIRELGAALRRAGHFVAINAVYYVGGGDPLNDNGLGTIGWNEEIGAGVVDAFMTEYAVMHSGTYVNRPEGTSNYDQFWQNWSTLCASAQGIRSFSLMNADLSVLANNPDAAQIRYCRATAMLDWTGYGVASSLTWGASTTPWVGVATTSLGMPLTGKVADSGCWKRQFQLGWVAVNPTQTQKSIVVGGSTRVIAAVDAFIGPS